MAMPSRIKIGGAWWRVVESSTIRERGNVGENYPSSHEIHIDVNAAPPEKEETLLHEVLHACCRFAAIDDSKDLSEEEFISRISPVLYMTLKENGLDFIANGNHAGEGGED